jgi:pimeloyl-ACP methyl ester carboxylesterase
VAVSLICTVVPCFAQTEAGTGGKDSIYEEVDPRCAIDANSIISIKRPQDIEKKRKSLIKYIWKKTSLPTKKPAAVRKDIQDSRYAEMVNLKGIDEFEIRMSYGVNSVVYHFKPKTAIHKLVLYHHGHGEDFFVNKQVIQFFLDRGYSVLAFAMPLSGMNSRPLVTDRNGKLRILAQHNDFEHLDSKEFSSILFFVEPVLESLNYVEKEFHYPDVYMIGLSGGGWTTVLYSALDSRIRRSYPVAGSLPLYLRKCYPKRGDYEQILPYLYEPGDYLDLYIMGSFGVGRKQLQILNKYDSCCFYGVNFETYKDVIKEKMKDLSGSFDTYLDDSHRNHIVSNKALEVILSDMESHSE